MRPHRPLPGILRVAAALGLASAVAGCGGGDPDPSGPAVEVEVPDGATLSGVANSLESRGLLDHPLLFRIYGRLSGADREIRAGRYAISPDAGWRRILRDLTEGRVLTVPVTIPEGFTLREIAPRLAGITGLGVDSVRSRLGDPEAAERYGLPGPTLEGYLFPETYRFARGAPLDSVVSAMARRFRRFWTPEHRARADSLGYTVREVTTLASIIQEEASRRKEMPLISAVYHNRLRRSHPLQADPTVLYALGSHRGRLYFKDIEEVREHPYNTYARSGLPPGPIAAPGAGALEAALHPADVDYFYFVARDDGSHVFTRTLREHNRAKERIRRGLPVESSAADSLR